MTKRQPTMKRPAKAAGKIMKRRQPKLRRRRVVHREVEIPNYLMEARF